MSVGVAAAEDDEEEEEKECSSNLQQLCCNEWHKNVKKKMNENKQKTTKLSQTAAAQMKGKKLKLALQTSLVQTSILANRFVVLANAFCSVG